MTDYQLHCFAQSGNAYKAALMLELCGLDWEPVFVDFFNGETRTDEYRTLNPMGEVPVLTDNSREGKTARLTQSGVILDYLAQRTGKFGWSNDGERRDILRWMLFDNHKLTGYVATYRFLKQFAGKGESPEAQFLFGRAKAALKVFDAHLTNREWVCCDRPTIADISCAGYLFWPEEIGLDWANYPNLASWLISVQSLDGWRPPYELMPGHPLPGSEAA